MENENIIVLNSYDGAEHSMTAGKGKKCGIIQLPNIFGENYPGAGSDNGWKFQYSNVAASLG
eukprot:scaffold163978_cov51-Attheya_sp.AAC.2